MQIYTKITEKVQDNFDLFGVASVHWCNRIDNDDNDDMIFHQHWSQFGSSISFNGGSALHNFTHHTMAKATVAKSSGSKNVRKRNSSKKVATKKVAKRNSKKFPKHNTKEAYHIEEKCWPMEGYNGEKLMNVIPHWTLGWVKEVWAVPTKK